MFAGTNHGRRVAALLFLAACSGAKTDRPVATTAGDSTTASPAGTTAAQQGKSMIRVVNAIPGKGTVDVTGDDQSLFTTTAYRAVTPYVEIKDNMMTFRVRPTGKDSVLADNRETMMDGYRYTMVVYPGDKGDTHVRILRDELNPDSGKARIRVINAAADVGSLDVRLSSEKDALFSKVHEGVEAGFKDVAPSHGTVEIRSSESRKPPVMLKGQDYRAGRSYTIVVAGAGTRKMETITFEDALVGASSSMSRPKKDSLSR